MPQDTNKFYQAPLEAPGYINPRIQPVPAMPVDLTGLFGILQGKQTPRKKNAYELMTEGGDPFRGIIPNQDPLRTNLQTLDPLDDPSGMFHSQDGFAKYGYSTILNAGDNEDRYSQNFKNDNPSLFWRPGFHPWEGVKKGFYWGGGFLEKTLESAVVKTGQGLASLYGMTIGNTIGVIGGNKIDSFGDWMAKSTDNIFSNIFDGWDQNLKDRYHYFQEKEDRDKKGFVQSLGDMDFWMNDVSDGLGFLTSSMFEAGLISKIGLGAKVASRLAPLAEGVTAASEVAAGGGAKFLTNSLVKSAVDLTTQTMALTAIESASEANEARKKIYDSFSGKVNPDTGMMYTEDEKKRLSAAGAAEVFKQNMAILAGPKFLETLVFNRVGKAIKGALGKVEAEMGRASGAVRAAGSSLAEGTSYTRNSLLKNMWKVGSVASVGFVSEGLFEENIQLAISRQAEDMFGGDSEYYRPSTDKKSIDNMQKEDELFGSVGKRYIDQTKQFFRGVGDSRFIDDELSKSVGIGGLFGVGGGSVHAVLGLRQQAKVDRYWNARLNMATKSLFESGHFYKTEVKEQADPQNPGKTKPTEIIVTDPKTGQPVVDDNKVKAYLNKMANIQGVMEIVNNTEDPNDENSKSYQSKELNKLARTVLFTGLAMEYVRAGKKDLLLQHLNSSMGFSDKDIQSLGYEPGMMSDVEKKQMLSKMTKIVEKLDNTDKWIEDNVIDNVSEPRQGFKGLKHTKTQQQKRQQEFEAKKAYLRGLAMQNAVLDAYLDDINDSETKLGEPDLNPLSSILDENGVPVMDFSVPFETVTRDFNQRIPALQNQIEALRQEFAHHWDNVRTDIERSRPSPKGQPFNERSKTFTGSNLVYSQMRADETLEKMEALESELNALKAKRKEFLENDKAFELREEDGNHFIFPKNQKGQEQQSLDQLQNEKQRRINGVKKEEIGIQKKWIDKEWQLTAALKEPKSQAKKFTRDEKGNPVFTEDRADTYFSRRMSLSKNAYNTYFQREVMDRDDSLGQRKLKLYSKDPSKIITAKKYKSNEEKLLKAVRIQGKVQTIIADINGKKLLSEIEALLDRDLSNGEFTTQLKEIIDEYNGKAVVVSNADKSLVDNQLQEAQDEYNFVANMMEHMPDDDRFNDKYYDIDQNGNYVIKQEYDSLQDIAALQVDLQYRIDELEKIKKYLNSIPEEVPGDWNNINVVKKRIADVYTETADSIINTYNQLSNNGQSEIAGDSLSTKQDLDLIDNEIDELGQLKVIFEDRDKTDHILSTPEFQGYVAALDKRIEDLKKIRDIVKERLSSRLRENHDFLVDTINNMIEQIGIDFTGATTNQEIYDNLKSLVGEEPLKKLTELIKELKTLSDNTEQTAEDKKKITEIYWNTSGQVAAIHELAKLKDKVALQALIQSLKNKAISSVNGTALMQKIKDERYYKEIQEVLPNSVLGALQILFYQSEFTQVGVAGGGIENFLDDQPSSPVYRFREDYNLRKFIRSIGRDESRTPDNTNVNKEDLLQFLEAAKQLQLLEDLDKSLDSNINMLDQIEKEKEAVQAKVDNKDNRYENLIISSIQQLFFIRSIASFLGRKTGITNFKNWSYIQAPGGAGKTQTLGTWFNIISGTSRDRVLATAFTEEAARGIKKAMMVGEEGPKNAQETAAFIREQTKKGVFDHDILVIDEFPAIDVQTQKELYDAISEYAEKKLAKDGIEFKVVTMGDTNQLTFAEDGSIIPRPSIIINPKFFGKDVHPGNMHIIPSLTVNFRTNLFAITSFTDQFKGSSNDNVNAHLKVSSNDPSLEGKDVKGVVSVDKGSFQQKLITYLKNNIASTRTRTLIVNEKKIEQYKKLLTDNGIKVITDPNDEVTKGVYVTTVKNVQGFSFDEVFIDMESNDKTLFSGTASPEYVFNKAMYVAASRARNLIVVTNFANFENNQDDSINDLENKAIDELKTKNDEFLANREQEIKGAKDILGDQYQKTLKTKIPVKAEEKVETTLDYDEDEEAKEDEEKEEEDFQEETEIKKPEEETEESKEEVNEEEIGEVEEEPTQTGGQVVPTSGIEEEIQVEEAKPIKEVIEEMYDKIKDKAITAYNRIRKGVVDLLFPTSQTTKYKVSDGDFTVVSDLDSYENRNLREGDKISLIPFRKSKNSKSPRNFGYAIVTPAIDQDGNVIPGNYRTVSILSDYEIDQFKNKPETQKVYNSILENEKRDEGFVSIFYVDVSDDNGFKTDTGKSIDELEVGKVVHSNSVKYFYNPTEYRPMNKANFDEIIDDFIKSFYKNHIESFPPERQAGELKKLKDFYANSDNAQIIIPTSKDVVETPTRKPLLNVPPDLRSYVRPGRPYIMFRPFHARSTMQFIGLSRKFLNAKDHKEVLAPIQEFIKLGKIVRDMLEKKGITNKLGISKSLSNFLGKAALAYVKAPMDNKYTITLITTNEDNKKISNDVEFSNIEMERIYNFYSMYQEPNTQIIKAETEKEIQNLTNVKRPRNYIFDDGTVIFGSILSYDPATKTFEVKDSRSGETSTKSGVIHHTAKSYVGKVQQIMDDIMNSNSHLAQLFTSVKGKVGFVTNKDRSSGTTSEYKGYKFMSLLGTKSSLVVKSYNSDGTVKEFYGDVIEILEDLFNFDSKGNPQPKKLQYTDENNEIHTAEAKFRVPVSLSSRNEAGELEHDFSFTSQNTSRSTAIPNAKYFETNFEDMLPTRVFVEFEEPTEQGESKESTKVEETKPEQTVEEFVNRIERGESMSSPEDLQFYENNAKEIEAELKKRFKGGEVKDVKNLTKEELNTLNVNEIRMRMTSEQHQSLDTYAKREGFDSENHFFEMMESAHPEEQGMFRDWLIECLI